MADFRLCSIEGCGNAYLASGLCRMHYERRRRLGSAEATLTRPRGEPERFVEAALVYAGDECLPWPFSKASAGGYGRLFHGKRYRIVSRVVCERAHGQPPSDRHEAAHSCGNSSCCNPIHIRWALPKENSDDKDRHGTKPLGRRSGKAKLDEEAVRRVRALDGHGRNRELAAEYGVHPNTIRVIQRGMRWGWLR